MLFGTMNQITILVGQNVRRFRKKRLWTQEQLAIYAKMGVYHLSRIELGKENVSITTLYRIANTLEVPVHKLLMPIRTKKPPGRDIAESE
jgi:transcriptional regulator with XRE-family HTH domain